MGCYIPKARCCLTFPHCVCPHGLVLRRWLLSAKIWLDHWKSDFLNRIQIFLLSMQVCGCEQVFEFKSNKGFYNQ